MPDAKLEPDDRLIYRRGEELKEEVAVLAAQLAALEQEHLRSSTIFQKLSQYFGFGAAGKLDWARFKLNFKREQQDLFKAQLEGMKIIVSPVDTAPASRTERPAGGAQETARQKMERMIADNPAPLTPHIRRVYRPLIEAEQSGPHNS